MKVKIAICDQNCEDQERYKALCYEAGKDHQIDMEVLSFSDEARLLFAIEENEEEIHIIFIDVINCGVNGIGTIDKIKHRYQNKEVIFLTHSKEEFRAAFDVEAFNYIVKEEDSEERFKDVLHRVTRKVKKSEEEYIVFNSAGEHRCIPAHSIICFETMNRAVIVYYGDEVFEFISTLSKLEVHLSNYGFIRVHRAFMIAKSQIAMLNRQEITLKNGKIIPVGRAYYKDVKALLRKRID